MWDVIWIGAGILCNALCLLVIGLLAEKKEHKQHVLHVLIGAGLGVAVVFLCVPFSLVLFVRWALLGMLLAGLISLLYLVMRQVYRKEKAVCFYDDGAPAKFYITGDKHRNFDHVKDFCRDMQTRRKDVLIILGDAGFNYYDDKRDDELKSEIAALNITLFCIHGNKENRPQNVGTYGIRTFCGGQVYYEPRYPNIYFAIDGEIYNFEGRKYMVVGGAHSVDKMRCLQRKLPYWEDEMPSATVKAKVEERLQAEGNQIFGMLTHTCPIKYLPSEMFMSTRQQAADKRKKLSLRSKKSFRPDIDRSTELWLGKLEERLDYHVWFCGHYHVDKQIWRVHMMHREIRPLHMHIYQEDDVVA